MNGEYNYKVSSKNSKRLLKNLQNTAGDYFFAAPCIVCQMWWLAMLRIVRSISVNTVL